MKKYFTDHAYEVQQERADVVVYLAADVDAAVNALVESQEFHELLMDYRAAGYPQVSVEFQLIKALVRSALMGT